MKYKQILGLLTLVIFSQACTTKEKQEIQKTKNVKIENYINKTIKLHDIPGMAIAVIHNDQIIHKGFYGQTSLDNETPITGKTTFKLYSLTKTLVATSIFKLIQEDKLMLNDTLSMYFSNLPNKWSSVTIANLLSHSSGLPDVRGHMDQFQDDNISDDRLIEMLFGESMEFPTNAQWNYNQTNYILLKRIIEKVSNLSFERYIMQHQFPQSNSKDVFFSSNPFEKLPNRPNYYHYDKALNKYIQKPEFLGKKNLPLAGINITLDEYIGWNTRLDNNELLNDSIKLKMFTKFNFTDSDMNFLHGWAVYPINDYNSIGFSGGSVSAYRKFIDKGISIILLSTGYKNYAVQDIMIDHIAGIFDATLKDKKAWLEEHIMSEYFLEANDHDLDSIYTLVKKDNPNLNLNEVFKSIGYTLFFELDRKEDAIELFKRNVNEYNTSFDAHGSLAYLYFLTNQLKLSREYYKNAQQLNPNNSYSKRKLKEIDEILKNNN